MNIEHNVEIYPRYEVTIEDDYPWPFIRWEDVLVYEVTGRYKVVNGEMEVEIEVPDRRKTVHWEWFGNGYLLPRRVVELVDRTKKLWIHEADWVINEETVYTCGGYDE